MADEEIKVDMTIHYPDGPVKVDLEIKLTDAIRIRQYAERVFTYEQPENGEPYEIPIEEALENALEEALALLGQRVQVQEVQEETKKISTIRVKNPKREARIAARAEADVEKTKNEKLQAEEKEYVRLAERDAEIAIREAANIAAGRGFIAEIDQ